MNALGQNLASSISGNIPKAILCVRQMSEDDLMEAAAKDATTAAKDAAAVATRLQKMLLKTSQKQLLSEAQNALERGAGDSTLASQTFDSLTKGGVMKGSGYLAMEVQYNPNTIYMETQAGRQVEYAGGNLGSKSNNQIVQDIQPVSTTMSFQLIFDDMNPFDAFMLENLAPTTVGNIVSAAGALNRNLDRKKKTVGYSVQSQIDGLMALLTQDETRQVIFFWAKMCFRGELTNVNTRYTMFNKDGNPIRGVVELTIRQGDDPLFGYDRIYWDQAFTKAFGEAAENEVHGMASKFSKRTNNNFLNLNL